MKNFWWLLKQAAKGFRVDKIPKLASSLAYYTIFSIGPMLLIVIYLAGFFWGKQAVEGKIYEQLRDLVGNKAAVQIQDVIRNASIDDNNSLAITFGVALLFIGATTVFSEIQDSINAIWRLKVKSTRGWLSLLVHRLISFSIVVSLAFLLLVSLVVNALIEALMETLKQHFPSVTVGVFFVLNLVVTLGIIWFLFAIIFKVLPDAVIRMKDVAVGALFTTILFSLGRLAISFYIGRSDIGSTYGTAGSLVVLLLWVYFSAIILYFGAEFTKAYALRYGSEIKPNSYAVTIHAVSVESQKGSIQENENSTRDTEQQLQKLKDKERK